LENTTRTQLAPSGRPGRLPRPAGALADGGADAVDLVVVINPALDRTGFHQTGFGQVAARFQVADVVGGAAGQLRRALDPKFRQGLDRVPRLQRVQQAALHLAAAFGRVAA